MIVATLASGMLYYIASQSFDVREKPPGTIYYKEVANTKGGNISYYHQNPVVVRPLVEQRFRGVVRQAYDYSCGSAALTTLLNGYVGTRLSERQTMNGLLNFGERERIVERRSFSLLDMKRFVSALGLQSGGYKASMDDLKTLDKPAIVLIHYAGFDHFVVFKGYKDGRIFVADPALGNISFMENRFLDAWDKTLFMINLQGEVPPKDFLAVSDNDLRVVEDATVNLYAFDEVAMSDVRQTQNYHRAVTMQKVLDSDPNSSDYQQPIDVPLRLYYKRK